MKAPSPAFSLYPKDILSDEHCASMTHEEFGAYMRLLLHCWLEGSVPSDLVKLSRILRVSHRTMTKLWRSLEPCFENKGDGRLRQLRLERERAQQAERSRLNSLAGIASAKARASNVEPQRPLNERTNERATQSQPSVSVSVSVPVKNERRDVPSEPVGRRNPLVGDRVALERECLALVRRMSELTGEDGVEVIARASDYQGARSSKLNPATMSDDRLLHAVRDLKADIAAEEKKRGQAQQRASGTTVGHGPTGLPRAGGATG